MIFGMSDNTEKQKLIKCNAAPEFSSWLASSGGCLAVTTYQAGKLMFIGWNGKQITLHARNFEKAMGLDISGDSLVLATRDRVHWFSNASLLAPTYPGAAPNSYDALYLPRTTYYTGDLFIHDLAIAGDQIQVVNTRFSCLASLSCLYSFVPRWRPPFVSDIAPEDRCHLNGLAVKDGHIHTVTALGASDEAGGWRSNKAAGGIVIDIPTGEIILDGLAMPHSPRWHDGSLWVLNSGAGELLHVDKGGGRAESVCSLPGYLRGMTLVGDYAVVGLCKIREKRVFGGLPIEGRYDHLKCGIALVDIKRGEVKGLFEFTEGVEEIYDIRFLPGVRQPNLLNHDHPNSAEGFTAPDFSYWMHKEKAQNTSSEGLQSNEATPPDASRE